jgi:catechol-2,3-dioxygenase
MPWNCASCAGSATGWCSLYMEDPEGNVVELVSRDPALTPEDPDMP